MLQDADTEENIYRLITLIKWAWTRESGEERVIESGEERVIESGELNPPPVPSNRRRVSFSLNSDHKCNCVGQSLGGLCCRSINTVTSSSSEINNNLLKLPSDPIESPAIKHHFYQPKEYDDLELTSGSLKDQSDGPLRMNVNTPQSPNGIRKSPLKRRSSAAPSVRETNEHHLTTDNDVYNSKSKDLPFVNNDNLNIKSTCTSISQIKPYINIEGIIHDSIEPVVSIGVSDLQYHDSTDQLQRSSSNEDLDFSKNNYKELKPKKCRLLITDPNYGTIGAKKNFQV